MVCAIRRLRSCTHFIACLGLEYCSKKPVIEQGRCFSYHSVAPQGFPKDTKYLADSLDRACAKKGQTDVRRPARAGTAAGDPGGRFGSIPDGTSRCNGRFNSVSTA